MSQPDFTGASWSQCHTASTNPNNPYGNVPTQLYGQSNASMTMDASARSGLDGMQPTAGYASDIYGDMASGVGYNSSGGGMAMAQLAAAPSSGAFGFFGSQTGAMPEDEESLAALPVSASRIVQAFMKGSQLFCKSLQGSMNFDRIASPTRTA